MRFEDYLLLQIPRRPFWHLCILTVLLVGTHYTLNHHERAFYHNCTCYMWWASMGAALKWPRKPAMLGQFWSFERKSPMIPTTRFMVFDDEEQGY